MIDEEEVIMVLEQSNMLCQKVKLMPQSRTNNISIQGITLGCIETEIIVPYSSYVLVLWLLPPIPTQMRMIYWFMSNSYIIAPILPNKTKHQTPVAAESSSKTGSQLYPNPLGLEPTKTKVVLGSLLWAPSLQLNHWVKSKEVVGIGGKGGGTPLDSHRMTTCWV